MFRFSIGKDTANVCSLFANMTQSYLGDNVFNVYC